MGDIPLSTTGPFPNYTITRRQDLSFQFNPPVGSLELANALAFKYPLEPDLESQLRRALLDHLGSENIISSTAEQSTSEQRHLDILTLKATPANDIKKKAKKWEITTGNPALSKRKRSSFTNAKRRKVSEVRQRGACEYHRTKKLECNPPCPHLETKITKPPESFLENLPAIEYGEPVESTIAPASITKDDLEGTYDFNSFLRTSAEDPTWNDIFEQTPANYGPTNDPWLPFENFPT